MRGGASWSMGTGCIRAGESSSARCHLNLQCVGERAYQSGRHNVRCESVCRCDVSCLTCTCELFVALFSHCSVCLDEHKWCGLLAYMCGVICDCSSSWCSLNLHCVCERAYRCGGLNAWRDSAHRCGLFTVTCNGVLGRIPPSHPSVCLDEHKWRGLTDHICMVMCEMGECFCPVEYNWSSMCDCVCMDVFRIGVCDLNACVIDCTLPVSPHGCVVSVQCLPCPEQLACFCIVSLPVTCCITCYSDTFVSNCLGPGRVPPDLTTQLAPCLCSIPLRDTCCMLCFVDAVALTSESGSVSGSYDYEYIHSYRECLCPQLVGHCMTHTDESESDFDNTGRTRSVPALDSIADESDEQALGSADFDKLTAVLAIIADTAEDIERTAAVVLDAANVTAHDPALCLAHGGGNKACDDPDDITVVNVLIKTGAAVEPHCCRWCDCACNGVFRFVVCDLNAHDIDRTLRMPPHGCAVGVPHLLCHDLVCGEIDVMWSCPLVCRRLLAWNCERRKLLEGICAGGIQWDNVSFPWSWPYCCNCCDSACIFTYLEPGCVPADSFTQLVDCLCSVSLLGSWCVSCVVDAVVSTYLGSVIAPPVLFAQLAACLCCASVPTTYCISCCIDIAVAMKDADGNASDSGSASGSYYDSEYSYSYSNCSQPRPGSRCMGHPDDLEVDFDNTESARSASEPDTVADEPDEQVVDEANPDELPAVLATVAATDEDMESAATAALDAADVAAQDPAPPQSACEDDDDIKIIDLLRATPCSSSATPFLGVVHIAATAVESTTAGNAAEKDDERKIPMRGVFVAKASAPTQLPSEAPVARPAGGKPQTEEEWRIYDQGQGQFYLGMSLDNYPLLQHEQSESPILTELGHDIGVARRKVQAYRAVAANYLHAASTEFWHQVWFLTWGSKKMRELDVAELCRHFAQHALCDLKRLQYLIWSTLKGFLEVTTNLNSTWETLCTRVGKPKSKNGWQAVLEAAGLPTKREVANCTRIMYRPPKVDAKEVTHDIEQGSVPEPGKASVPPPPPPAPKHGRHGKRPRSNQTLSDEAMTRKFGTATPSLPLQKAMPKKRQAAEVAAAGPANASEQAEAISVDDDDDKELCSLVSLTPAVEAEAKHDQTQIDEYERRASLVSPRSATSAWT
eukprot:6492269-Amphidinium_carterae.2